MLVVLVLAGLWLTALLGSGRAERAPSTRDGASGAPGGALSPGAPVDPVTHAGVPHSVGLETRAELRPDPAAAPAPLGATGWWGRAIDGETGKAPVGATFAVARAQLDGREVRARVEDDGLFLAPITTWNQEVVAVRAPGYATAYAVPSGLHRVRGDPQRVLLWRAATLVLRVTGADAPFVTVSALDHEFLQAEGATFVTWNAFTWPGQAQADGTLVFTDLPARVRLSVEIGSHGPFPIRRTLTLEPDERFELVWPVGGEFTLAGQALAPGGQPVEGLDLWILADELARRNLVAGDERRAFAETRTVSDGTFAFAGLVPGRYLVGPAPREARFVPLATAFTVGGLEDEHTLQLWYGVTLRGTVRAADGSPAPQAVVTASAPGLLFSGTTRADGSFTLGPLAEGPYELVARADGRASEPSQAKAGEQNLELALPAPEDAPR